ncbi:5-methyltetrahydrofolate--homocysteine methyltransferase [Paraglaciecola aquimarina]|uniref:5-methyltetrahydrofolate--homocysteine methyltransferase n=1 Tax=Paraglaciecola algarum TaxID=3050085 RepID=A0ABS9D414_9ALTE|nr:5-methyltetrahydrofolate--homocysteine methyltransferase [Paraglaciecola sp. G1-23]
MKKPFQLNLLTAAISSLLLYGCGDAETTIIEKEPIVVPDEDDHDDDHGDDEFTIESMGRLAVLSADSNQAVVFDLDDNQLLDTFSLIHNSNSLTASADYRFAVIASRSNDYVGFIDSGMWREDHGAHLHDYEQAPEMNHLELDGSRPTHIVKHDGHMAVFYDGDADSGIPAAVQVLTDTDISSEISNIHTLDYPVNMHGVAEPVGEYLLSTVRRDDAENTSAAKILPDQVAVYHLHDGEYEQEQILEVLCPDLHGAAQNGHAVLFGCSDGILVAHQHDEEFEAEKILNIEGLNGLRIGTIYGHEESETFIGIAAGHGGGEAILVKIDPENEEMETLEWQPAADASPVSYAFAYEGEAFLILDSKGFLNILTPHDHDGETHWELAGSVDISEEDVSTMPEGMKFSMTVAENGHYVYVADPIAQHVLQVHIEDMEIEGDIELDFAPANITWLGIAEEAHEDDEHDH